MKGEITLGDQTVSYTIHQSERARYLRISIGVVEGLVVTVPRYGNHRMIEPFLRQKAHWIIKHLNRAKRLKNKTVLKHSTEEYQRNKKTAFDVIKKRVEFFNSLYKFRYNNVSIRNQTSLWGSCTREGNLQFNYKLMHLPQTSIDYVVVHELCHLKQHNHSERFWKLVEKTIPNYKAIRKSLRGYIMG